ncbi:ATP-binding protein [Virgibacillus oceani]
MNRNFPYQRNSKRFFNLNIKMIMLISVLIIGILLILGLFLNHFITKTIEDQIGNRALSVATSVASMEDIIHHVELDDPTGGIQEIVDPIRNTIDAEYIVVGNKNSIRYSHPVEERIGEEMVGEDNERALQQGASYVSKQTGSLGPAIRGKVPIRDQDDEIIGVVSVGFLTEDVQEIISDEQFSIWLVIASVFLLGIIGAVSISTYIKRLLFSMEPEEISEVLLQREAILQSTKEGIVAINQNGETTMINESAREIFANGKEGDEAGPKKLFADMHDKIESDVEMVIGDDVVLVNRTPIKEKGEPAGAVATFRKKTELEHITQELNQVKQYANALRSQSHEFSNKLYTILGLLQLNNIDQAEAYIKQESNIQDHWLTFLTNHVADPMVHGLLQGKYNQANELGIAFHIHEDSELKSPLIEEKQEALLTSLGNVIENAIESIKSSRPSDKRISIYFSDAGNDIVFEIEDSGQGISEKPAESIFEQGFSTKGITGRGTGLALTKKMLNDVGGEIMFEESDLGGTLFVIVIPKGEV